MDEERAFEAFEEEIDETALDMEDEGMDETMVRNRGKKAYVWDGPMKGRVGLVISMGRDVAKVQFTGIGSGCEHMLIKRENLLK